MTSVASSFMGGSQHQPRTSCCQTGYPVLADPLTGRTICSCQLQSGVPAYLSRVPSLPETVYPASSMHLASLHRGSSGTYPGGYSMSDSRILKAAPPSAHIHSHYEAAMAASPYAFYPGFDINGVRRKNATRESTAALKAWLYQHRKNPYPTKAEKVMLAIISQMTLTQVSTWFANARRRLKKERKLGDNDLEDLDDIDVDGKRSEADTTSSRLSDCESDVTSNTADNSRVITDLSDVSDAEEQTPLHKRQTKKCVQRLFSPDSRNELYLDSISSPNDSKLSDSGHNSASKEGKENCLASNSKCKSFQDGTSTISNFLPTPCVPKNDYLTLHKSNTAQNNHTKSKIWSIDSIIG